MENNIFNETIGQNKEVLTLLHEHAEILADSSDVIEEFVQLLKETVISCFDEFIGYDDVDTAKNIKIFSSVAMSQFLTEMSEMAALAIIEAEALKAEQTEVPVEEAAITETKPTE